MIENIPQSRKDKAIRLLQFLVYSNTPMKLPEAVDIVAIRAGSDKQSFDVKDRMPIPSEILGYCPGLISIVHDDSLVVHLAHVSVKEYLLRGNVEGFMGIQAQVNIVKLCLTYMSSTLPYRDGHVKKFTLLRSAASMYSRFAKIYEASSDDAAKEVLQFLQTETAFEMLYDFSLSLVLEGNTANCLIYLCSHGFTRVTQMLLSQDADGRGDPAILRTAFRLAMKGRHRKTMSLLLEHGADINDGAGIGETPLQVAVDSGDRGTAQFLLEKGADMEAESDFHTKTPLRSALDRGDLEMVRLLVSRGGSLRARGAYFADALQVASSIGNKEIAQLLLDRGADVNATSVQHGNALQAASFGGHKDIAQLLVDRGADVSATSIQHGSALQAASRMGHGDIVKILLDAGADVNAEAGVHGTAVEAAYWWGHSSVVELLVNNSPVFDEQVTGGAATGGNVELEDARDSVHYTGLFEWLNQRKSSVSTTP